MKKHFSEQKIMSVSMIMIILVLIVAATVAWYALNRPAGLHALGLTTEEIDVLYVDVRIEPYRVNLDQQEIRYSDILTNEELKNSSYAKAAPGGMYDITRMSLSLAEQTDAVAIDMGQPDLNSVETDKLAPGVYGEVGFYILSKSELKTDYRLLTALELQFTDLSRMNLTAAEEEEFKKGVRELAEDHIRFYAGREENGGGYTYTGRIACEKEGAVSDDTGLSGELTPGEEKQVTVYWCWPYEYTDIPEDVPGQTVSATSTDIESYDLGDTKIGNYVTDISFKFTVTGDVDEGESGK